MWMKAVCSRSKRCSRNSRQSKAIQSLAEMPLRFALIPEADELKRPLRSFPHHSHRVIYQVDEQAQTVSMLRVYHSARAPLQLEDLG